MNSQVPSDSTSSLAGVYPTVNESVIDNYRHRTMRRPMLLHTGMVFQDPRRSEKRYAGF